MKIGLRQFLAASQGQTGLYRMPVWQLKMDCRVYNILGSWSGTSPLRAMARLPRVPPVTRVVAQRIPITDARMKVAVFLLAIVSTMAVTPMIGCAAPQQPDANGTRTAIPSGQGTKLQVIDNSPTFSRILDINNQGHVLGTREIERGENGGSFVLESFFDDGEITRYVPVLEGFTSTEVVALSDNDLAVGHAGRPIGHPQGGLAAVLWDPANERLTNLGACEGDKTSQAQGINADGTTVVGYSTGPDRMRPCVWIRGDNGVYACSPLPTPNQFNPFIMSGRVVVSPDGQTVAACISEKFGAPGVVDSSLYAWKRDGEQWKPRKMHDEQPYLYGINNEGLIVGATTKGSSKVPVMIGEDNELQNLPLLPSTQAGRALGVNEQGFVVGYCEDPYSADGGPRPFLYSQGKMQRLALPQTSVFGEAAAINDRGQVVGFSDFELPGRTIKDEEGNTVPEVKALGYILTPEFVQTAPK